MKRTLYIWMLYALCLVALVFGMSWVTLTALRTDRSEKETRRRAYEEQTVGIALWRMDAMLITLTAREAAHPWYAFESFFSAETAYTRLFAPLAGGEVLVPSPLLTRVTPHVRLHFQFGPDGTLSSPEAPQSNMRDLAEMRYLTADLIEEKILLLDALGGLLDFQTIVHTLMYTDHDVPLPPEPDLLQSSMSNTVEYSKRYEQVQAPQSWSSLKAGKGIPDDTGPDTPVVLSLHRDIKSAPTVEGEVVEEPLRPFWIQGELFLFRWVRAPDGDLLQGCWLDWLSLRTALLEEVNDLLPAAALHPVTGDPARMLAALPVTLDPGPIALPQPADPAPLAYALAAGWACVALAALAIGWVLKATLALGERRATFVSAVTHELRTPLTTFRMYTDMLLEGRVRDPARQRLYLETLQSESGRLAHLVENVLAFARLERGRAIRRPENTTLGVCLDRMEERLAECCKQGKTVLDIVMGEDLRTAPISTDTAAIEQILLNLIDNACKYAATSDAPRVELKVMQCDRWLVLRMRDNGPGIPGERLRRLFTPFHKSASDAANSAPGVGLGLALSRRLARRLGGDLVYVPQKGNGAIFELRLPCALGGRF